MPENKAIDTELVEVPEGDGEDDSRHFERLALDDVMNVRLRLTAELGQAPMKVRDVLALKVGSIVTLNKMAGEPTDLYVNGLPLARGEVVVINDTLHVRMSEILHSTEVIERGNG